MSHPSLAHRAVGALPVTPMGIDLDPDVARAVAERLHDGIDADPDLRPKFGSDLSGARTKLAAFFVELFGGPPEWSSRYAYHDLAGFHRYIHITEADAGRWLGHARRALVEVVGEDVAVRGVVHLRPVAEALVNEDTLPEKGAKREQRYQPTSEAVTRCQKGDLEGLVRLLEDHPHLVDPLDPGSAELTYIAAVWGRVEVLQELIARGTDVNKPARVDQCLLLTPLCGARARGRREVVDVLVEVGAVDDVFTAAYLGDVDGLRSALQDDLGLANEPDPASDFFGATVLDHAVRGMAPEATVAVVTEFGARPPAHGHQLLTYSGNLGRSTMVATLLDLGADARFVMPGRWVLHAECTRLLLEAGANVNHAPTRFDSWIWRSCTGNNANKDDPDFVGALLAAGADPNARAFDKTALHFTAKAGFVGATTVLLGAGADPNSQDGDGVTPLWHLLKSGKKADRVAIAKLLLDAGADPTVRDKKGRSLPAAVAADTKRPPDERAALAALLS